MKKNTIGLLWHSVHSGNLGVVALTESQIAILKECADKLDCQLELIIFGWRPDGAADPSSPAASYEFVSITAKSLLNPGSRVHQALSRCALVLDVGEGDSFSDIYGLKRLIYMAVTKRLASARSRLVLAPQTVGPFATKLSTGIAKWALNGMQHAFARDPLSMEWLIDHGFGANSTVTIDMAFKLPYSPNPSGDGLPRVGLNVSGLLYAGGYSGHNELGLSLDYKSLTHRMIEWLLEQNGVQVFLVPHVSSKDIPSEDDIQTSRTLIERYPQLQLAGPFSSPIQAKSFMSGLDFFSGGRMHACLGAFSSGVPTLPMAYSRKFNGLFNSIGYTHFVDCKIETTDAAFAKFQAAFMDREALRQRVREGNTSAQLKLKPYSDFLAAQMQVLARHD